jgi:hypothetical protein
LTVVKIVLFGKVAGELYEKLIVSGYDKKNILTSLFMYYIENILDSEGTKSIETILTSK